MPFFPASEPRETQATLIGESAASGAILMLVIGAIFGGVGAAIAATAMSDGEWPGALFGSVFVLVGLGVATGGGVKFMASRRLSPPAITVSVQPLHLGESFRAHLVQRLRSKVDVNAVTVTLICREWVQYQQGTDTRTETHDLLTVEVPLPVSGTIHPPACIEGDLEFIIPEDAMHSFSAAHNRIDWLLHVHSDIANWPDYKSDVMLEVAAVYAPQETV